MTTRNCCLMILGLLLVAGVATSVWLSSSGSASTPAASICRAIAEDIDRGERQDAGPGPLVYVCLRRSGVRLSSAWEDGGGDWRQSLMYGIAEAYRKLSSSVAERCDAVEICLCRNSAAGNTSENKEQLVDLNRGLLGMQIRYQGSVSRYAPSEMLAKNLGFEAAIERFQNENAGHGGKPVRSDLDVRTFEAVQYLVFLRPTIRAVRMFRGNTVVPLSAITRQSISEVAERMGGWLKSNVHADGRMTYEYFPSRGEESSSDNTVRQWMATLCLSEWGRYKHDPEIAGVVDRNVQYNLAKFYRVQDDKGLIEARGKAKLGAIALAALTLTGLPATDRYRPVAVSLDRTIDSLWQEDGSFRTFYVPADRDDNQNFYPGEALLYWAHKYTTTHDPALLSRIMKSFAYYREWHLNNRNPAFIPWHTQADYILWQETHDPALRDWIFEMNDWLVRYQQWGWQADRYPDIQGRFYDPNHREYGPPHASSTGVYLESLADAFRLAREVHDGPRMDLYRKTIVRGLRSVMQLEFAADVDMFYISHKERVRGGIRTNVYDNRIRVDNVQHNLMALMKVLAVFTADDYVAGAASTSTTTTARATTTPDPGGGVTNSADGATLGTRPSGWS